MFQNVSIHRERNSVTQILAIVAGIEIGISTLIAGDRAQDWRALTLLPEEDTGAHGLESRLILHVLTAGRKREKEQSQGQYNSQTAQYRAGSRECA